MGRRRGLRLGDRPSGRRAGIRQGCPCSCHQPGQHLLVCLPCHMGTGRETGVRHNRDRIASVLKRPNAQVFLSGIRHGDDEGPRGKRTPQTLRVHEAREGAGRFSPSMLQRREECACRTSSSPARGRWRPQGVGGGGQRRVSSSSAMLPPPPSRVPRATSPWRGRMMRTPTPGDAPRAPR